MALDLFLRDRRLRSSARLLAFGPNELRYRWTITLAGTAESGTLPIEAWLTAAFLHGNLSPPTEEEVTVTLEVISVTYR